MRVETLFEPRLNPITRMWFWFKGFPKAGYLFRYNIGTPVFWFTISVKR